MTSDELSVNYDFVADFFTGAVTVLKVAPEEQNVMRKASICLLSFSS
jgi:hypothetical protein